MDTDLFSQMDTDLFSIDYLCESVFFICVYLWIVFFSQMDTNGFTDGLKPRRIFAFSTFFFFHVYPTGCICGL